MLKKEGKGKYTYTVAPVALLKIKSDAGCTGCYFHTKYGRNPGYCQMERPFFKKCKGFIYISPSYGYWIVKEKDLVD